MSPDRLRSRDVQQPFRGTNARGAGALTLEQRCLALQTRLPDYAFFSGATAALLRGVPLPLSLERDPRVHVTVPETKRAPTGKGVVGHAARLGSGDVRPWNGLRISSAGRVWCELGATLALDDLVAAGDFLIHRELPQTSVDGLHKSLRAFAGRRGIPKLKEAIGLLDDGAESRRESLLRMLLVRGGVRGFVTNLWITTSDGSRNRGDIVFVAEKVIVEYQGQHHFEIWAQDMTRKSRLQADGWLVLEINARDLENPDEVVARVLRALATSRRGR